MDLQVEGGQKESFELVENYDIEKVINSVKSAGKQLCDETASAIHRFRMTWVEALIERYKMNPGRPVVHLCDLLDSTQICVALDSRQVLLDYWRRLCKLRGPFRSSGRLRGVRDPIFGRPSRFVRLDTWKFFGSLTGLDIADMEPFVTKLRISCGRTMRLVENPKLPFNLATFSGARLIGYQGDTNSRNAAFTNKDLLLHEAYATCVRGVVGDLTITTTVLNRGGFCEGTYLRTNVGKLITTITRVAGLDNSVDQKLANNPLPLWLHACDRFLIRACISALWDAEGSVNYRDLKLAQAVPLDGREGWMLPKWPANVPFRQLRNELQAKMMKDPPLLLVSASLLLSRLNVISRILPVKASATSTGPTAYWQLRIHHDESIRRFRQQINLLSMHKAKALDGIT